MTRKTHLLGVSLLVVLAASSVTASAASANSPWHFGFGADHTILKGTSHAGSIALGLDAGAVTCPDVKFTGTVNLATTNSTELSLSPESTYTCTAFGFVNVVIHANECSFRFTSGTLTSGTFEGGGTHIDCPAGKVIDITVPGCTVTIEPQTVTGGSASFANRGSGSTAEITIGLNLAGIHYTEHPTGIFPSCVNETVTTTNGTMTGSVTVTGQNTENAHVGVSVTGA